MIISIAVVFGTIFALLTLYFSSVTIDLIRAHNRDWTMAAFYALFSAVTVVFCALSIVWRPM